MGNKLFGTDISGLVAKNIGPGVNAATLHVVTPGTRSTTDPTAGTAPTTVNVACKGFLDKLRQSHYQNTLVKVGDQLVVLVGDTISGGTVVPKAGDKVTILGGTYEVIHVDTDPAKAVYECVSRG